MGWTVLINEELCNIFLFSVQWVASGLFAACSLSPTLKWKLITKQSFCEAYPCNNFLDNAVEGIISLFFINRKQSLIVSILNTINSG